jgi:hypothetical protein
MEAGAVSDRISRRTFLAAVGGTAIGGTALGHRYFGRPAGGESDGPPARLLIIHKPCGTVPESYDCAGGELDFSLSPILEPFAPSASTWSWSRASTSRSARTPRGRITATAWSPS